MSTSCQWGDFFLENEEKMLQKRLLELSRRADARGIYTYTDFLTLAEQDVLCRMERQLSAPFRWMGGFEGAERRIACFGREEELGYPPSEPIVCLRAAPANARFAGDLGHRDFLGAVMGLGVRREKLGDILIHDKTGYLFCLEEIADFLCEELTQAGRTTLVTKRGTPPEAAVELPEETDLVVASERLDAVIAAVWRISRSESQAFFPKELVFINGRVVPSPSHTLEEGDTVSVRGKGRFRYEGIQRETKKGRLRVTVRIFGGRS